VKRLESENATLKSSNNQLALQNRQLTANVGTLNSRLKATNDDLSKYAEINPLLIGKLILSIIYSIKKGKDAEITQLSLEIAQTKMGYQQTISKLAVAQKRIADLEQNLKEVKVSV